ncbi:tetratricopeptide repeat protein [Tenacibaculum xiamenense]|uniref:tetratricopeptide repeat protein n=1 Tax=Tenacibaculum xiamenense TaxID=1261553 RepID=UPI0038B663D6
MNKVISLFLLLSGITFSGLSQTKIDSLQEKLVKITNKELQLKVLDTLTTEMIRSNHSEQREYLEKYVQLAKTLGNFDLAASKSRFIAQQFIYSGQTDSAIYVVEEMLKHKPEFKKKSSEAHLLLKRAGAYFNKELLIEAIQDYDKSGDLFMQSGDSIFAADARFFAGHACMNLKDFLKAVNRFEKAYELYDLLNDIDYANSVLSDLGGLYEMNGFYDKAIFEKKKALRGIFKTKNYKGISTIYLQLSGNYYHKKDLETSNKYIDSALHFSERISNSFNQAHVKTFAHIYKLQYYLHKNDLEKAAKHFQLIDKHRELTNSPEYYDAYLLLHKANYYSKLGRYSKAEIALKQLLGKKGQINDVSAYIDAEKQIAALYANKKNYSNAYKHLLNHSEARDSLYNERKTNTFLFYQSQFEAERKDNEISKKELAIKLLEKDQELSKSKRKILWVILISIILLSITISYYIWRIGKQKRNILAKKIARNKKELEEFTQLLIEKSRTQESLSEEIEKLKEEIGSQKSIEKLQDLTSSKILTNDDWYKFKEKFKNVYPSFFIEIKRKGFDLTKSEERLVAMEKLYLDTKEIASMLAISQDSVTRSRSRLRKKINAPKGHSILEFLEVS